MAAFFLILLVVAWVVICLPAATRARERGPVESTALFRQGLDLIGAEGHAEFVRTLGRPAPRLIGSPPGAAFVGEAEVLGHLLEEAAPSPVLRPAPAQAPPLAVPLVVSRARTVLLSLIVFSVFASAGFAVLRGAWEPLVGTVAVLAIYVSWLLEEKHRRAEHRRKVRSIQAARRARPEPLRVAAGER